MAQYYVGLELKNFNIISADVNCDTRVNIIDALLIAQYDVGQLEKFCDYITSGPEKTPIVGSGGSMSLVYDVENRGLDCIVPTSFLAFNKLSINKGLPNPFLIENGKTITHKSQWVCRRAEISAQIQYWGTGTKPKASENTVNASFSNNKLTVKVGVSKQSVTFSSRISYPSSGKAPYAVLIKMDGAEVTFSLFSKWGCAVMSISSYALAAVSFYTSYNEKFQKLFPKDPTAGSYIGWAWGVSLSLLKEFHLALRRTNKLKLSDQTERFKETGL